MTNFSTRANNPNQTELKGPQINSITYYFFYTQATVQVLLWTILPELRLTHIVQREECKLEPILYCGQGFLGEVKEHPQCHCWSEHGTR